MSEYLQNSEYKQGILKGLITDLHKGRNFEDVKREFERLVDGIDATEIARMEQKLIAEGMHPEEIKKLCDVHAAVFRESLSRNALPELTQSHPLQTLKRENNEARKLMSAIEFDLEDIAGAAEEKEIAERIRSLGENIKYFYRNIDRHFSKKENIFFPYLEKHDITGPPSVMWSVDDEIRGMLKELSSIADSLGADNRESLAGKAVKSSSAVREKLAEMFYKEEDILSPMMLDALTEGEWEEIREQSVSFGAIFSVEETGTTLPLKTGRLSNSAAESSDSLELDTGVLTAEQINAILTSLPVDITFVDNNDEVKYFSQGRERIFTRTRSIIGRKVQHCHPPESVHVVEKIVSDFKSGRHSTARFWLELDGRFIHIGYTALRDGNGEYMGTMEVSQDLTDLRALTGERRLLQYSEH